ncbi:DUF2306 domain-containing protein [Tropicibacter naphthalenivorans]|uniref:DUF2306 domain-containing protein n=1 Tax=Tropicibacter naphthalenivorans TaxID=441103 RepID=A0A0P1GPV5_9RHOB|nr:DUF2306 domain-containing protein [Tropicibacter naphthalenivorans]CUH76627.1 hypothetical protein TRN7648_01035 [Tropicibacter naphthalenivorans]SMC64468.1 Uncharacterized membrane protein [Tropicibacter naphthalenivorans]
MSLTPFLDAAPIIQTHALAATVALGLGPVVIYRQRRDRLHKVLGYVWVLAMAFAALSSFGIRAYAVLWIWSPIHLLSVMALWSLWRGMAYAFQGNIRGHLMTFRSLYWRGVLVAAVFNFLPGRVVNRMFFNDMREAGYIVIALGLAVIAWDIWRQHGAQRGQEALV